MKAYIYPVAVLFALQGCVTVTEKALKVQVYQQNSTMIAKCKDLGPVRGEASLWTAMSVEDGVTEAKVKLREAAADLGGDSVALLNTDILSNKVMVQGTALKCY